MTSDHCFVGCLLCLCVACSASDSGSSGESSDASGETPQGSSGGENHVSTTTSGTSSTSDTPSSTSQGGPDSAGTSGSSTGDPSEGTESTGAPGNEACQAPSDLVSCDAEGDDPFQAMGLNCPASPAQAVPIHNEVFVSADPAAWRIPRQFGSHVDANSGEPTWGPREGERFLMLTTGVLSELDVQGVLLMPEGDTPFGTNNDNPTDQPLPAPMIPDQGSAGGMGGTPFVNCDGVGDCSDSLEDQWDLGNGEASDMIWLQFDVDVPLGTFGFSFDFVFFSEEFPEFVGSPFNDIFAVWASSETYTGNLCFIDNRPCTVTALANAVLFEGMDPELDGTGFDGMDTPDEPTAQATGWFEAKGSAAPGETLTLTFALFDMFDSNWDTTVLLDNFRWDCEGCVPTDEDPCVGIDPV